MSYRRLSPSEIEDIVILRKHGSSLPEISSQLGIPRTTVFHHIKGVVILPEYLSQWAGKRGGSIKRKRVKEETAYKEGIVLVQNLTPREKMLLLSILYWGEGNKGNFMLINSDPKLISLFVYLLRDALKIDENRIRAHIRMFDGMDKNRCLQFWSNLTQLPVEKFTRFEVLQGKKKGKLEYGMCRIRITKGGDELKRLKGINRAVSDTYAPIA